VGDDGSGFTFDQAARGLGIAGMRERALLVDGDVQVESRPGVGTQVSLTVPLDSADTEGDRWTRNGKTEPRR
jgi:two-component system sensor histidine kinase UhpB